MLSGPLRYHPAPQFVTIVTDMGESNKGENGMNVAFFLLPKQEVVCLTMRTTVRQTLERMEFHRYTSVPILNDDGTYAGTVTEGDLLWYLKNNKDLNMDNAHRHVLSEIPLRMQNKPVRIDANMEDLIRLAKLQNFVPVIDDMETFIGIVRRSDIIDYCASHMFNMEPEKRVDK
jgi:CBS domain-containing protein